MSRGGVIQGHLRCGVESRHGDHGDHDFIVMLIMCRCGRIYLGHSDRGCHDQGHMVIMFCVLAWKNGSKSLRVVRHGVLCGSHGDHECR